MKKKERKDERESRRGWDRIGDRRGGGGGEEGEE